MSITFYGQHRIRSVIPLKWLLAAPSWMRSSLFIAVVLLGIFLNPTKAHAYCETTGDTLQTYKYTAANLNQPGSVTFTGTWKCYNGNTQVASISKNICAKAIFNGNSTNGNTTLPYSVSILTIGGLARSTVKSDNWYFKGGTVAPNNTVNYTITVNLPSLTNGSTVIYPSGSYNGTLQLYMDMQGNGAPCEGNKGGGWDSDNKTLSFTVIIPEACQLTSISDIDFGQINDIGKTAKDYTANGAVVTTCNSGTPYTIYLSNGNNRIAGGNRQMANGGNYLPYQLYQDAAYTQVWDETGGTNMINGSGGKSLIGTGGNQTTTIYGRIAKNTILPPPNNYTDTVIVTTTY